MFRFILSIVFAITGLITYSLYLRVYSRHYNLIVNRRLKVSKDITLLIDDEVTTLVNQGTQYKVVYEDNGTDKITYFYDDSDELLGFDLNGTKYWYVKNLQGDITGILDNTGVLVVTYHYTTWGGKITPTGTLATTVGEKNPYRYRGYRYDTESKLYYLQSRYYSPEWGRFVNADGQVNDDQGVFGVNVFAYCLDNPVNRSDPNGDLSVRTAGLIIDGILLLVNIGTAALGLKATLKLIKIFARNAVKITKRKIVALIIPYLGTAIKAILGFAVPALSAIAEYAVDLFFNMSLGYAIAYAVWRFIPASRRILTL